MNFRPLADFMDRLTGWVVPGNSVCVYYKNEEVFRYGSGYSDVSKKTPMTPDKIVNIYSCSKITTVVAALQLVERGYMLLTDRLCDYIPEYAEMNIIGPDGSLRKAKKQITIGNLFSMAAGFTYNTDTEAFRRARELTHGRMDTQTVARCIAGEPLIFEPGEGFNYSLCHDVLAAVVELVSHRRFADYVRENVFEPAGIKNTAYHRTPEMLSHMAAQYAYRPDSTSEGPVRDIFKGSRAGEVVDIGLDCDYVFGPDYDSGGAGIATSVEEYAKLANALANHGRAKTGEQILSPGAVELLRTNQLSEIFRGGALAGYGYGLGVRTLVDKGVGGSVGPVGEFGWGGAAGATMLVDPDNEFALFYAHHMKNPLEEYYQPRLRNAAYMSLGI